MPGKRQDFLYQAQAILARRDHSRTEVAVKLRRKGFTEHEIAKALTFLQEQKLLDDARFAQAYVASILRGKSVGPRYVSAKLKQKGVGEKHIQAALAAAFTSGRERELIGEATEQWKRTHPKYAQDRGRLYRFLIARGFNSDAVREITSRAAA